MLLHDAYIHRDDIRAALAMAPDRGPGLVDSLDFVLGELIRNGTASAEPSVARLLDIPAAVFTRATGLDADKFLLAATGRLDAARLGLPESINSTVELRPHYCDSATAASMNRRSAALCARGRNASTTGLGGAPRSAMNRTPG